MKKYIFSQLLLLFSITAFGVDISIEKHTISPQQQNAVLHFTIQNQEFILQNSLQISIDSPHVSISSTQNVPPVKKYIHQFKQTKSVYDKDFDITVNITNLNNTSIDSNLYVGYASVLDSSINETIIPIHFSATENKNVSIKEHILKPMPKPYIEQVEEKKGWAEMIQDLVQQSNTAWMQILLAFLLGLLLSLTPCIYPMIPITIGILHSSGKKSFLYNLGGSICYALGLATTFSILGFLAATAGGTFGSLLSQSWFVILLVIFIGYMSLTMIGVFEMYTPSFMKGEVKLYKNLGPFLSTYIFGAITGTIASPCISPGLALLLSIVATIGNTFLGLALLFAFGIGMSMPLIIVGTFSHALHMLPQSGMWMIEIKKFIGFLMLATCFYYLSNIMPTIVITWLFTGYCLFTALFYLIDSQKSSGNNKTFKALISIIMIALTLVMSMKIYEQMFYYKQSATYNAVDWQPSYEVALQQAKNNKDILLIDFWANHCTICKAIDKKIFQDSNVKNSLSNIVTFLKVDATDPNNPEYTKLKQQYKVHAQPTILLVDPHTEKILKRWSSEPYNMSTEEFITKIKKYTE